MVFSGHSPRKRFGQHWLVDVSVLDQILMAADINEGDRILEIGPGQGALTKHLLNSKKLTAIEIDPILCLYLNKEFNDTLDLINEDILNIDLSLYSKYNKICF